MDQDLNRGVERSVVGPQVERAGFVEDEQDRAPVGALESLEAMEPVGPIERVIPWLRLKACRGLLRAIVASAPAWVSEQILSASERIGNDRAVLWMSEN